MTRTSPALIYTKEEMLDGHREQEDNKRDISLSGGFRYH